MVEKEIKRIGLTHADLFKQEYIDPMMNKYNYKDLDRNVSLLLDLVLIQHLKLSLEYYKNIEKNMLKMILKKKWKKNWQKVKTRKQSHQI